MTHDASPMRAIRPGDRGHAVEDVQRRLLLLGYDLGATGVDGVFLDDTAAAIRSFQADANLYVDGIVGPRTWSALVDSTFSFGDRYLYLRTPHFHGNDVAVLQSALNGLGFNCGPADAIFGPYTERAVIEFQENAGVVADGVVGVNTLAALDGLRHIWGPRGSVAHSAAVATPTTRAARLARLEITIVYTNALTKDLANRLANVGEASTDAARIHVVDQSPAISRDAQRRPVLIVLAQDPDDAVGEMPVPLAAVTAETPEVRFTADRETLEAAMRTAVWGSASGAAPAAGTPDYTPASVVVRIGTEPFHKGSKQGVQNVATTVLDAVCAVFG